MHHYWYEDGRIDDDTEKFHIELINKDSARVVVSVTGDVADLTVGRDEFGHERIARVDLLGRAIACALNEVTRPEEGEATIEVQA